PPVQPTPAVQAGGVSPEEIFTEGIFERAKKTIRLVADTRTNSLIVYANDDGLKRVRELLETIDKPLPDTYQTFTLQYAKVADVANLVTQIAQGMSQTGGRAGRSATIVPDEVSNTFHVIADREEMERVGRLIQQLDLPSPELERHVVELKQLRPSQVAQMVQALLGAGGSPAVTPLPGGRGRMPGMSRSTAAQSSTYQVIPLDEAQILIVLCMPEDWAKIEDTIKMWDENVVSNTPELETFPITKGNAANIAATLANFYRQYEHPVLGRSTVAIQAEGDSVMVFAIKPAREEIGALIRTLDVEDATDKVEILPLVNADAAQIAQQLQSLFMPRGPRGGGTAPLIMVESVTNSLIVQAERADMDKIKNFALEIDQKIALQSTERRFYDAVRAAGGSRGRRAEHLRRAAGRTGCGGRGADSRAGRGGAGDRRSPERQVRHDRGVHQGAGRPEGQRDQGCDARCPGGRREPGGSESHRGHPAVATSGPPGGVVHPRSDQRSRDCHGDDGPAAEDHGTRGTTDDGCRGSAARHDHAEVRRPEPACADDPGHVPAAGRAQRAAGSAGLGQQRDARAAGAEEEVGAD
ncbi:MAG TPA: secretin N-terminal domain-containing protein, partial [Phycisphaerae bacterium]|nr:secretin N-terminal domain-containing protein [Phycisphaerae bacterium]